MSDVSDKDVFNGPHLRRSKISASVVFGNIVGVLY